MITLSIFFIHRIRVYYGWTIRNDAKHVRVSLDSSNSRTAFQLDSLCIGMVLLDLVQFRLIVEGHEAHLVASSILDVGGLLARVGIYDAIRGNAEFHHLLDLTLHG